MVRERYKTLQTPCMQVALFQVNGTMAASWVKPEIYFKAKVGYNFLVK